MLQQELLQVMGQTLKTQIGLLQHYMHNEQTEQMRKTKDYQLYIEKAAIVLILLLVLFQIL